MVWLLPLKGFFALIPRWVWIALAIAGAVLFYGHLRYNAGQADVQAKFDAYRVSVQAAADKQAAQNKLKEAEDAKRFAEIAAQHERDLIDAKRKADDVIAGLRNGSIKLRKQWRGCTAAQAAADSQGIDEDARLREESAGRIIGNAAEADSWIRALQDVIKQIQKPPEGN